MTGQVFELFALTIQVSRKILVMTKSCQCALTYGVTGTPWGWPCWGGMGGCWLSIGSGVRIICLTVPFASTNCCTLCPCGAWKESNKQINIILPKSPSQELSGEFRILKIGRLDQKLRLWEIKIIIFSNMRCLCLLWFLLVIFFARVTLPMQWMVFMEHEFSIFLADVAN